MEAELNYIIEEASTSKAFQIKAIVVVEPSMCAFAWSYLIITGSVLYKIGQKGVSFTLELHYWIDSGSARNWFDLL
jgi:hypothetical protein